jgi:glycerol kinase
MGGIGSLRVDGGAVRNDFLMQFQADILGVPVERAAHTETTAFGVGLLAGIAAGFWASQEEALALCRVDAEFTPMLSEDERQQKWAHWRRTVAYQTNLTEGVPCTPC